MRKVLAALGIVFWSSGAIGTALPESDGEIHLGVASCSNSVCHGKVSQDPNSIVWLNEYRVWLREDYHSRAYGP